MLDHGFPFFPYDGVLAEVWQAGYDAGANDVARSMDAIMASDGREQLPDSQLTQNPYLPPGPTTTDGNPDLWRT